MSYRIAGGRRCARFAFAWVCSTIAFAGCTSEQPLEPTFLGAAVPSGSSKPLQTIAVSGRVLDWRTGAGVQNVAVEMGGVRTVSGAGGLYTIMLPSPGAYDPIVGGLSTGVSHVPGPSYRGDFLTNSGNCVSRYGTIANARTGRPIAGATVSLASQQTTTDADGWYRIDLGCPANGLPGFNTTFMTIEKAGYVKYSQIADRGVYLSVRIDIELLPA